MIILNLKGGTGNQLFQYALGRHLALKNKDVLKLDVAGLDRANAVGDIYRPFALESFNIVKDIATKDEIKRLKYPYGIMSALWRFLRFKLSPDKNTSFHPKILNLTGHIYLDGYWQSPLYFEAIREILLKELTLAKSWSEAGASFVAQIKNTNAVSLHVRRGDYTNNARTQNEFGPCTLKYYKSAVAEIEKRVSSPTYFIFSDDISWVKDNLPIGDKVFYVKGKDMTDVEDIMLMSICQHNIIANSSFSWWGAWLNQNPNKIVIAPTPWFDKSPFDKNLIPSTWIQLPK